MCTCAHSAHLPGANHDRRSCPRPFAWQHRPPSAPSTNPTSANSASSSPAAAASRRPPATSAAGSATSASEREANEWFRRKLARAKMKADLAPLRAMQRAMLKDWRAAAWFLERTQPEKFGRRNHRAFTQKQANALVKDITSIVGEELTSGPLIDRLSSRIEAAVRYACHAHNDMNRTAAELGRAMKHHDMKSPRYSPTLADFPDRFHSPKSNGAARSTPPSPPTKSRPTTASPPPPAFTRRASSITQAVQHCDAHRPHHRAIDRRLRRQTIRNHAKYRFTACSATTQPSAGDAHRRIAHGRNLAPLTFSNSKVRR